METVFLDWGLSFGTGVLFAIAGRRELERSRARLKTRTFRWGLVYLHLGVLPISLAAYAMNAAWMWMYWADPAALPAGIQVLAFLVYEACFVAGFAVAAELSKASAWALAALTGAGITLLEATARTRLFRVGTFDEFRAGRAAPGMALDPFAVEPLWALVSVAGAASLVALVVVLRALASRTAS